MDKIFKIENVTPNFTATAIFYIIYSETRTFKQVVDQVRSQVDIEKPPKNKFHIIVVPYARCTFENELEELGLLNTAITLHSFQWMPIHLDVGVLSLEIPNVFSSLFIYQNALFLSTLSKILWQLCFIIGKPKFMLALGQFSVAILNQYEQLCADRGETDKSDSDFGAFVVVDRNLDYPSALLTPGTYSALLNEVYTCRSGVCENKEEITEKLDEKCNPVVPKQIVSFNLDSTQDSIYADIKNRYFTEVTSVLSNLTKQLKSEKINSKEMALDEIKHYVQTKLQATKSRKKFITNHLLAAESIINILGHRYENQKHVEQNIMKDTEKANSLSFLDELLVTENDKYVTLRLFCLLAITQKLSESEIRTFWHKYLQQFGFANGFGFLNLVKAGFISKPIHTSNSLNLQSKIKIPKFTSSDFYVNAKNLKQIPSDPDKINLKYPTCASYVYGGAYIPLVTQVAGMILNSLPVEDIKSKLDPLGPTSVKNDRGYPLQTRSVLVYVIGGVTYAEIAACNLLETLTGARICILSDKVITGNDLMRSIVDFPN